MKRIYVVSYLLVAAFALSCKAVDYSEAPPAPVSQFVTDEDQLLIDRGLKVLQLSDAERVAQRFMFKDTKKLLAVSAATRADHLTAVRDSAGNAVMYVVNFEQGGFCIVSATKKAYPILAHGEDGFFDLEKVDESGVCIWLDDMVYGITHRDTLSEEERIFVNSAWAEYEKRDDLAQTRAYGDMSDPRYAAFSNRMGYYMNSGQGDAIPLSNASSSGTIPSYIINGFKNVAANAGCPEQYAIIVKMNGTETRSEGPLLTTNWHQNDPFNMACPMDGAGKSLAGCVAIAMVQIMNYHCCPLRYSWSNMRPGNYNLSNLIADIGYAVEMVYGQTASASCCHYATAAFNNKFDYNSERLTIEPFDELWSKRPYYASGANGTVGHAWVVDGVRRYIDKIGYKLDYQVDANGTYKGNDLPEYLYSSNTPYYHTHLNMGGIDRALNAWYANNVNLSGGSSHSYTSNCVYITAKPKWTLPGGGGVPLPGGGGAGGGGLDEDIIIKPIN